MDPLIGRAVGPYQIEAPIGGGGMGAVYRAVHRGLRHSRAIKILPPQLALDPHFVERFRREAIVAAGLRHPNIVLLHDTGEDGGLHYIVMELVPGRSLRQILDDEPVLRLERSVQILRQLAGALDYAHSQGVYHRDVKPANVIVGAGDHLTLVDFGIARGAHAARLTGAGLTVGTPAYMAPEMVRGHGDDAGSDLYALGIVAYELLTGQVPFGNSDSSAVMLAQLHTPPPSPRAIRPDLPPSLEGPLLRQLAKEPSARFPSAVAFVAALEAAVTSGSAPMPTPTDSRSRETSRDRRPPDRPRPPLAPRAVVPPAVTPPSRAPEPHRSSGSDGGPYPRLMPPPAASRGLRPAVALMAVSAGLAVLGLLIVAIMVTWQLGREPSDNGASAVASTKSTATSVPPTRTTAPAKAGAQPPSSATSVVQPTPVPTPAPGPADRLRQARDARLAGDYPRALAVLQALRQTDPTLPGLDEELYQTHLAYGKALHDGNDFDGAHGQYGEALKIRPNDRSALSGQRQAQLGRLWAQMEAHWTADEDRAIAALEEIVTLDSEYRDARAKLYDKLIGKADRLTNQQGDRVEAFAVLIHALEIDGDRPEADVRLAAYSSSPSPASVFVFDSFDNPGARQLPLSSPYPSVYRVAYEEGEYRIQTVAGSPSWPVIQVPGTYADAAIVADARLDGPSDSDPILVLGCRRQSLARDEEYRLYVSPSDRVLRLLRVSGGSVAYLTDPTEAPMRSGNNRIELRCFGQTVSVKVNGALVAQAEDGTFREGLFWIGAGHPPNASRGADARFDNLALLKR